MIAGVFIDVVSASLEMLLSIIAAFVIVGICIWYMAFKDLT